MESESNTSENILFIDITYKQYIVVYLTFTYYIVCRLYVRIYASVYTKTCIHVLDR